MKLIRTCRCKDATRVKKADGWAPLQRKNFGYVTVQVDINDDKKQTRVSPVFALTSSEMRGNIFKSVRVAEELLSDLESAKSWIDKTTANYQKNGWTLE